VTKLESSDARNSAALQFHRVPHASHRDGGYNPRNGVCRLPIYGWRIDRTQANNIGANMAILKIQGPGPHKGTESSLRRAVDPEGGRALHARYRASEIIEPPSFRSGNAFCTVNSVPLTLMLKKLVKMLLGDLVEGSKFSDAGVGENDVDSPLGRDGLVETI